jgi:hypothetical protein
MSAQRLTPKALANFSAAITPRRWLISAQRLTPKALANFSPAVGAQRQPWGNHETFSLTLKGLLPHRPNAFSVSSWFYRFIPGFSQARTLG